MQIKHFIAIATATVAFTVTAFGQGHPDIDKVKVRKAKTQSIQSPRDVASGQATGKRKALRSKAATQDKLGNFEIQDINSPRDPQTGQATGITSPRDAASGQATGKRQHKPIAKRPGFMDYNDDLTMNGVVAGQNSGGTITNQRSRRPKRRK
jgi:hypothetical protein